MSSGYFVVAVRYGANWFRYRGPCSYVQAGGAVGEAKVYGQYPNDAIEVLTKEEWEQIHNKREKCELPPGAGQLSTSNRGCCHVFDLNDFCKFGCGHRDDIQRGIDRRNMLPPERPENLEEDSEEPYHDG